MAFSDSSVSLWREIPLSLFHSVVSAVDFRSRARGAEILYYWIFLSLVTVGLHFADAFLHAASAELVLMALSLPVPALLVRRTHDIGYNGWWAIGGLLALAAIEYLPDLVRTFGRHFYGWQFQLRELKWVILAAPFIPGELGMNRYGSDPRLEDAESP